MSNKIDISLDSISSLIDGLNNLNNNLDKISRDLCKEIIDDGSKYLDKLYKTRQKDDNITDIHVKTDINGNNGSIIAYGKDVIYEEFGTGDEGAKHQHPVKSNYNLNPYNSGPYIRNVNDLDDDSYTKQDLQQIGITSGNFWLYKKDNVLHYTQGVPSGQEMWRTRNYLLSNKYKEKLAKKGKEINDYIVTTIKK